MNIKGLSDTSFNKTVTTSKGGCKTVDVPAPGTYFITETQQSGWTASTPDSGYVVSVEPNTAYSYSFLNCKKPTCEQLFSVPEQEGECCATRLNISNADGASLQSLSYTVTGGVVNSVASSSVCGILSTVPANINGTTSGTLNFNTACTMLNPMSLSIQTTATNATGNVCITWVGTFKQGNQTFTCSTQSCIQCRRMPKDCGNPLTVTPYNFAGTQTDWRTFTISNVKMPVSEISFVDIKFVNEPALHHNGGQLLAPTSRSWTVANSGGAIDPYTQIRLGCNGAQATHGAASGSYVKFNLGVDSTLNYTGTVKLKIGYCDGDTCEVEYLWQPPRRIRDDSAISISGPDRIRSLNPHIFELSVDPPDSAASMSVVLGDEEATILAVSAPYPAGDSTKDSSGHSTDSVPAWMKVQTAGNVACYLPAESEGLGLGPKPRNWPRSMPGCTLRLVYRPDPKKIKKDPKAPDSLSVSVRFYDADGRLIGFTDKDVVAGIKLELPSDAPAGAIQPIGGGMSLDIQPNPTSTNAVVNLGLARSEIVSITLTDMQGKEIRQLLNAQPVQAGNHTLPLPTDELANGSYIITVRTLDGRTVTTLLKVVK
ncbi:MAG: T9SS type A sorting domain-containing protein [Armatimonadetes bacterium]|nr:T9SS type A sorting domain-containing protein [Armatimonadota bacterium]